MELETTRAASESQLSFTRAELENTKQSLVSVTRSLEDERRDRRIDKEEMTRRLEREVQEAQRRGRDELESLTKSNREAIEQAERANREAMEQLERANREALDTAVRSLKQQLEDERAARLREVSETQTQAALEKQKLETKMDSKWREIRQMKEELEAVNRDLEREKILNGSLRVYTHDSFDNCRKSEIADLSIHRITWQNTVSQH